MIALYFSRYRGCCCNTGSKNEMVQAKPWKPGSEALINCSLVFHHQQQTFHILKFCPQQPKWFSLSVNSLHIGQ